MPAKDIEKLTENELKLVIEQVQKIEAELLATQVILKERKLTEIYSFQVPTMRRAVELLRRFSLELEQSRYALMRGTPYTNRTTTKNRESK